MALILADRVRETSTTTGTGALSLAGAVVGYQTFSSAIGNTNTCYYAISNPGVAEWEVGIGTYATSGNTLTRTTILKSSNSNAAVNFSAGTKDVFVTYPATKSVYLDASGNVTLTGTTTLAGVTATSVTDSGLTSGRVTYAGTAGLLQDSANLTFNGTTLTANTIGAFTLSGTVAGGGNNINNVIIGATTPLAGSFTTLSASGDVSANNGLSYITGVISPSSAASGKVMELVVDSDRVDMGGTFRSTIISFDRTNTVYGDLNIQGLSVGIAPGGTIRGLFTSTGLAVTGTLSATGLITSTVGNNLPVIDNQSATTGYQFIRLKNTTGNALFGVESSVGGTIVVGTTAYDTFAYSPVGITLSAAGTGVARLSSTGLAVTGTTTDTLTDTNTTWVNLGYGSFNAKNASNTNNNYSWMTFLESNGSYSGAIGVQNIVHSAASVNVEGALIFATKTSGVGGFPTEKMRLNSSGNLGLGVTPSAWASYKSLEINAVGNSIFSTTAGPGAEMNMSCNAYYNAGFKYAYTDKATYYSQSSGANYWFIAPSGTAGSPITWTSAMTLDASGNLGIGITSPVGRLNVKSAYVSDATTQQRFEDNTGTGLSFGGTSGGVKWLNVADVGAPSTGYPLAFQTGGTERARIDASGNLLVGTTSSSGLVGNNAGIVGGILNTLSGTNSINTSATTVATLPSRDGATYLFTCANISDAGATTYNCASIITQCTTALVATALSTASFASISVSGLNIQITSTLATKTFKWSLVRIL